MAQRTSHHEPLGGDVSRRSRLGAVGRGARRWMRSGTMLRRIAPFMAVAALAVVVPVVLAATPARVLPTQRIDVKVLLISADGTEPGFGAWKAELAREGVPYDAFVAYNGANRAATLTDDRLADYGANHAQLQRGDPGDRRPRPQHRQRQRHDELPLRAQRHRVGDPGQVRADVRHPPAQRLHRAVPGPRAQHRRRRDAGRQRRHADGRRQGGLPLPQGAGADGQRRPGRRRDVRLRGDARQRAGLADPPRGAQRRPPTSGSTRIPTTGARRWS